MRCCLKNTEPGDVSRISSAASRMIGAASASTIVDSATSRARLKARGVSVDGAGAEGGRRGGELRLVRRRGGDLQERHAFQLFDLQPRDAVLEDVHRDARADAELLAHQEDLLHLVE